MTSRGVGAARSVLLVAVLISITVVGCSSDDDEPEPTTTTAAVATTTAPPPTTTTVRTTLPPTTAAPTTVSRTTVPATTSTTSTTTTTVPPSTTTTVPAGSALVLRDNGLGSAAFGADPDGVIDYVSSIVGKPTVDSGWIDPLSLGACPGTEIRTVTYGDLQLFFSDESTVASGRRHFFSYVYGPPFGATINPAGLATDAGISVGSAVLELRNTYPAAEVFPGDATSPATFSITAGLTGLLTAAEDTGTITEVQGGFGCGE
jgi:hypothetical protein